jgi:endonuclease/exonuclease/phosphatase family metal-dependent hydrolase
MVFDVVSANLGAGHQNQPYYRQEVHERSWATLLGSGDILLVQEARWPPNRPRNGLYAYPFKFSASFVVTDFPATLIPAEDAVPSLPPEWRPIVAAVNVETPGHDALVVASVHCRAAVFPNAVPEAMRRTGETDAWWNDVIFADLVRLVDGRPFIVGGDWNTCPAYDAVQSRHTGGPAFFQRAAAAGWLEADPGGAATWWDSRGIGFQLDHVFVGGGVVAETTQVDRAPVDDRLSDHARVRVTVSF